MIGIGVDLSFSLGTSGGGSSRKECWLLRGSQLSRRGGGGICGGSDSLGDRGVEELAGGVKRFGVTPTLLGSCDWRGTSFYVSITVIGLQRVLPDFGGDGGRVPFQSGAGGIGGA
jgi:hypothetical protein